MPETNQDDNDMMIKWDKTDREKLVSQDDEGCDYVSVWKIDFEWTQLFKIDYTQKGFQVNQFILYGKWFLT